MTSVYGEQERERERKKKELYGIKKIEIGVDIFTRGERSNGIYIVISVRGSGRGQFRIVTHTF